MADYKTCLNDTKDAATLAKIEAYMDQFSGNVAFDAHIAEDIAWWSISIAGEQADLIAKMLSGNYLAAGTDAGLLMDKIIIGKHNFKSTVSKLPVITPADVGIIAKSFISEALKWEKMDGYVDCGVTKPWTQGPVLEKAFTEMKSFKASEIIQGLTDFKNAFKSIASDVKLCQADTKDQAILDKIETYLKSFPDIKSFQKHINGDLAWNSVQIGYEQTKLLYYLNKSPPDFANVGYEAGLIVDRVIIGKNSFGEKKEVKEFLY